MAKKITSSRPKNAGAYTTKKYSRPGWIKVVRLVSLIILSAVSLLAIIGLIIHLISHF